MSENLKKFLALVAGNKELEAKLMACNGLGDETKVKQAAIKLAKENGIELTEADFEKKEATGELSDDELDAVAGGGSNCGCFAGGGGGGIDASDGKVFGCACVAYGQGGDGRANDANCVCALYGYGYTDSQWLHPTT